MNVTQKGFWAVCLLCCVSMAWAGATSSNNENASSPCDTADGGSCQSSSGMPVYSFKSMLAGLSLRDTPLSYVPPVGPPMNFVFYYNAREASQPAQFDAVNLGHKWTSNWISYIQDDPTHSGKRVFHYVAGGGGWSYSGFDASTGKFTPSPHDATELVRVSAAPITYELHYSDGRMSVFSAADGSTSYPRKIYLSKRIDAQGNVASLHYDAQMRLVSVTDAVGQTSHFHYQNPLYPQAITGITGPFGRHVSLGYDSAGRLHSITDAIGMTSTFTYEGAGYFIDSMTTPYGTTTFTQTKGVGSSTELSVQATGPLGYTERTEYRHGAPGIPFSSSQPPSGMQTFNRYLNYRNAFYWNKTAFEQACTLSANGKSQCDYTKARIKHFLHSPKGQTSRTLESVKNPLEGRVWLGYPGQPKAGRAGSLDKPNRIGRVLDDGSTQLVRLRYNSKGKVTKAVDPEGRITIYTYATNGIDLLKVERQTATGLVILASLTWNSHHQPISMTNAAGQTHHFSYNAAGQVTSVTNPLGHTITYQYDTDGYLTEMVNAEGRVQRNFTYDAFGRVASVTDSEGYTVQYQYDALNRITRITYPDGSSRRFGWNKLDLVSVTDRAGHLTTYEYDADRRLVSKTDALGQVTRYTYYPNGKLKTLTDPRGHVTTWVRDIQGRIISKQYADGQGVTFTYDNAGRLIKKTDALGQSTHYHYGLGNRIVGVNYTNAVHPTASVSFNYATAFPRLKSMTDGHGTTLYHYYPVGVLGANRLKAIDGPLAHDKVVYIYDALGRSVSRQADGSTENFNYDALGRLTGVQNVLGSFTNQYLGDTTQLTKRTLAGVPYKVERHYADNLNDRHLKSLLQTTELPNPYQGGWLSWLFPEPDTVTNVVKGYQFSYNSEGLLQNSTATRGEEGHPSGIQISWDLLSWLSGDLGIWWGDRPDQQKHSMQYQYDADHRLTAATGETDFQYSYDAVGNLLALNRNGSSTQVTPNMLNQVAIADVTQYLYDANGNLLNDGEHTYVWDAANRLIRLTDLARGHVTRFAYDGFSRRITRTETDTNGNNTVIHNLWCGQRLCTQFNSSGAVARYFPQGQMKDGTAYLYARNQVGSVVAMVGLDGQVKGRTDYGPYGQITSKSGIQPDFAYAGLYRHQHSGLYLATYRAYNPAIGRWLNRDPIKEAGGINLYGYVMGNPVGLVDPLGTVFGLPAGEKYGAEAAMYWARQYNRDAGMEAALDALMGGLASLWTPCTSNATVTTLVSFGGIGSLAVGQMRVATILGRVGVGGAMVQAIRQPSKVNIAKALLSVSTTGITGSLIKQSKSPFTRAVVVFNESSSSAVTTLGE